MGLVRIRDAGEDKERFMEPHVSKRVLHRIIENKDKQYKEMRQHMEHKLHEKQMEVGLHLHNEKNYERIIKERERITYLVGVVSFLVGGGLGWLIH